MKKAIKDTASNVRTLLSKIDKKIASSTGSALDFWKNFYQECVEWLEENVEIGTVEILEITSSAYVRVVERVFGFRVIKVYNNGDNVGREYSYKTLSSAMKKANEIKNNY